MGGGGGAAGENKRRSIKIGEMMHHCCGSSQGHVMGTCTCGMYHNHNSSEASSYGSMLFSMPNNNEYYQEHDIYSSFTPSHSSVDCTLSLGTPSTRLTQDEDDNKRHRHQRRSGVTSFCWDLLHSNHNNNNITQSQSKSSSRGSNNNNDSLLARRCANCDTTSTPLWRNGPRGPKSLCNACGIRFKKEQRRASAAGATSASAAVPGGAMESARVYGHHHNNSWYAHSQSQKMMGNELRFMDDSDDRDSDNNGIPFLSWKLNIPDRTSLVDERW
ncbi:GATA transcription factor 18 [Glycine soja]